MWISNNSILSLTSGQVYEVSGYLKSTQTGTLNIGVFLHQSGSMSNLYSDRSIETFATSTGGTFQFYLSANTTAADGVLTFETSNQSIPLEIDEVSLR